MINQPRSHVLGLPLLAVLLTASPGWAQFPPPPPDPNDFKISSDVELVLLDVSVKGKDGGFVSGLTKEQFQVRENGRPQTITSFAHQDIPVTVGLVVDNSGSMRDKRPEVVTAALTFVKESRHDDEIYVVNFNDRVSMGLPDGMDFSDDSGVLRNALLTNPVQGRTALYDAINKALNHLEKGRRDKKTLVVISDGGDNASEAGLADIMARLQSTPVTVYTVGIYSPDDKEKNPGVLKQIARLTGGEAYIPDRLEDLVSVCTKIAKDIRNRYTVGYVPDNRNFDDKVRKIEVIATDGSGAKLKAHTRASYTARSRKQSSNSTGAAPEATTAQSRP